MSGDEVFMRRDEQVPMSIQPPDRERHYRDMSGTTMRRGAIPRQLGPTARWERLAAALARIPRLEGARCKGEHPFFDWPDAHRNEAAALHAHEAHYYFTTALRTCASCPLAGLRGRCIEVMLGNDPNYSGVAGGEVFYMGARIEAPRLVPLEDEVAS